MDAKHSGLNLIKYRDPESPEHFYFWTERRGDVDAHVSPMFTSQDEAVEWLNALMSKVKAACDKMKEE